MARITVVNDEVRCELSLLESFGAFHKSISAPISSLTSVQLYPDPWNKQVLRGFRAPGTGFPYLIMLGTMRFRGGKDFCAIYKRKPVYVLEFSGEEFRRWIVSQEENIPELVQAKIGHK